MASVRVEPKSLIRSKTFWFGILTIIIAIAKLFGFAEFVPSESLIGIIGAITIVLRIVTGSPIGGVLKSN